jgi:Arc/MetJ-type ribon-helix-helix transcriptional regulator
LIEPDTLDRLTSITARTGLSKSEQIRQGIRWWLESREWPLKGERSEARDAPADWRPQPEGTPRRAGKRRR